VLTDFEKTRTREWLRRMRGKQDQGALTADITATLPDWSIRRETYSKYESGAAPIGEQVLDRFRNYWTLKGFPEGPDFSPAPEPEAAPDLAQALVMLTQELAAWRQEREGLLERVADLELLVAQRVGTTHPGVGPSTPPGHVAPPETAE
jgi:hypothetical protein